MQIIRPNAIRIKRFRELKETLRTHRDRLLVGIDIAKAQHVAQVRLAHTRVVDPKLSIPNTAAGFAAFWAHLARRQAESGAPEIVCALEPTGTYHTALAQCLEAHGADVVLVAPAVAHLNRRTQDGTWDKSDPKDAANLCDLLEQGKVLFYALPEGPAGELRSLVRLLRQARTERAACRARWRNTLRPALGPAGEPLPAGVYAALPALLQGWEPAGGSARPGPPLGPGLAACTDLAARVTAVQQRIATLEAACVQVARALPAFALLQSIPGVGPTVAALLVAEIGDVGWYTKASQLRKLAGLDIVRLQSGQWAGTGRISRNGRPLLRWALYQAALGATRTAAGRAAHAARLAKRAGDRHAGFKAMVEGAAAILRTVWGVWRSGVPYDPTRAPGRSGRRSAAA
jgi:transposase